MRGRVVGPSKPTAGRNRVFPNVPISREYAEIRDYIQVVSDGEATSAEEKLERAAQRYCSCFFAC